MKAPIVGFVGMTHLGINSAAATAERGFQVVCLDESTNLIQRLKQQDLPVVEPGLSEIIAKNADRLQYTDQMKDLSRCDVVYISEDVSTNDKGESDLSKINSLIEKTSQHLSANAVLVILCQVPPGFTRSIACTAIPLDRLFYQVETLIFGKAIERAVFPERFIIGCANPKISLPTAFQTVLAAFQCPILPMRYESAELAKISINCCLVSSIGVANTLSEICEKIGADWSEIVPALRLDKRIGQFAYLSPGLGIAGGNLERDLTTVLSLSKRHGTDADIVSAWVNNSQYRRDWVLRLLSLEVPAKKQNTVIGILGLAYKEDTDSIKNSPSISLLEWLKLKSYTVKVYDPAVSPSSLGAYTNVTGADSALDAIHQVDVLIIMTPWQVFKRLDLKVVAEKMHGRLIIDPYKVLDGDAVQNLGIKYFSLGTPSE